MDLRPPCVVLNEPQLAENIGACARVMANFGLADLRLVRPRDGWPQDRAWASASGADWPLNDARVFDRLEDAVADLQLVYATTARPREINLPILTPREAAGELNTARGRRPGDRPAVRRRAGGPGQRRHRAVPGGDHRPIDPRFRSLNLAQAVALNAYEWRMTLTDRPPAAFDDDRLPADQAALDGPLRTARGRPARPPASSIRPRRRPG